MCSNYIICKNITRFAQKKTGPLFYTTLYLQRTVDLFKLIKPNILPRVFFRLNVYSRNKLRLKQCPKFVWKLKYNQYQLYIEIKNGIISFQIGSSCHLAFLVIRKLKYIHYTMNASRISDDSKLGIGFGFCKKFLLYFKKNIWPLYWHSNGNMETNELFQRPIFDIDWGKKFIKYTCST